MASTREVLDRTLSMMALAESVEATTPGAAGLAYQAAELAVKAVLIELDGSDPWSDEQRYQRAYELLGIDPADLRFMHTVRLRDFYAHATRMTTDSGAVAYGLPLELPSEGDAQRCVQLARRVVDGAIAVMSA